MQILHLQLKDCLDQLNKDSQNEKLLNEVEFPLINVLSKWRGI